MERDREGVNVPNAAIKARFRREVVILIDARDAIDRDRAPVLIFSYAGSRVGLQSEIGDQRIGEVGRDIGIWDSEGHIAATRRDHRAGGGAGELQRPSANRGRVGEHDRRLIRIGIRQIRFPQDAGGDLTAACGLNIEPQCVCSLIFNILVD